MLLSLGPLQLDPAARAVVVGVVSSPEPAGIERAACGADLVWLPHPARADAVAEAGARSGLPVGVTITDAGELAELVAAGAASVEIRGHGDLADVITRGPLALWCTPAQATRALDAGVAPERILVDGGGPGDPGIAAATLDGDGPALWGAVLRAVHAGARAVRTTDARAVRRVVTVADRLVAVHGGGMP